MKLSDVIIDDRDFDRPLHEWVREISDLYDNRCGTVGGIIIDLRDDRLLKNEWTMPNFALSPFVVRDDPDQPKLWFPWFGPAEVGSIWPVSRKSRIVSTTETAGLEHSEKLNKSPLRIDTILREGDKISIENVVPQTTDHQLEHQHDCEIRCAYLLIQRRGGTTMRPTIPLTFRGQNELLNANNPMNVLSRIERRINDYFKEENPRVAKLRIKNTYATRAFIELKEVQGMLRFPELHNALGFVDRALFLGYLWAKAEVDFKLKPLAMARQAQSRASSAGAKKGAKTRQKQASNKEWRHQLKTFATIEAQIKLLEETGQLQRLQQLEKLQPKDRF